MFFSFIDSFRRRFAERRSYARTRDLVMRFYDLALRRSWGKWLPGHGKIVSVQLADLKDPLYVRLGSTDWLVLEEIFLHGEYDPLAQLDLSNIRQIVDLGANVGFSIRLWKEKFPNARILAVEPDHANMEALRRNCGDDDALQAVEACVAAAPKMVQLDRSAGDWGIRMEKSAANAEAKGRTEPNQPSMVRALTFNQIITDAGIDGEIDLLKCDIEGAEIELFADCADWIGRIRALIVEIHRPYSVDQFEADVKRAGCGLHIISSGDKRDPITLFCKLSEKSD
jgi:FkbM family methyltransferase